MSLPKTNKGFTLIELMVAIAIVAILATVGLVVYGNTQKQARDSARVQNVAAIANALENKKIAGEIYYQGLVKQDFSNGAVPTDPKWQNRTYCMYFLTNTTPPFSPPSTKPAYWNAMACPNVAGATTLRVPQDYSPDAIQLTANTVTSWIVCASLETDKDGNNAVDDVVCESSRL